MLMGAHGVSYRSGQHVPRCIRGNFRRDTSFHILFLDGVTVTTGERLIFRRVPPPTVVALENLVYVISKRVGGALERQGLLGRDFENSFLMVDTPDGAGFEDLLGHSIVSSTNDVLAER